jgi:capsular polysaccharide biosynthesis protein
MKLWWRRRISSARIAPVLRYIMPWYVFLLQSGRFVRLLAARLLERLRRWRRDSRERGHFRITQHNSSTLVTAYRAGKPVSILYPGRQFSPRKIVSASPIPVAIVRGQEESVGPDYVATLEDVLVLDVLPFVTDSHHVLQSDVSRDFSLKPYLHQAMGRKFSCHADQRFRQAALLGIFGHRNYYHFLLDVCSRIHLLRAAGVDLERIDAIIVNPEDRPYQSELFSLLGLPLNNRVHTGAGCHFRAKELHVPSVHNRLQRPVWAFQFLRNSLLPQAMDTVRSGHSIRRLYLSRRTAPGRRARNQNALDRCLRSYGFSCVVAEDLPVVEQIAVVNRAEVIVAEHGAGLTNLIFARPDVTVVELHSPYWLSSAFVELAHWVGGTYAAVFNRKRNVGYRQNRRDYYRDFYVDIEELEMVLQKVSVKKM